MHNRVGRAQRAAAVAFVAVVGTMTVQTPALAADPVPTTSAEAKVLVDKLTAQQRDAEKQFNEVNEKFTNTQGQLDERNAQIQRQDGKVAQMRTSISSLALSRYHNKGQETSQALLTGNTDDAIHRLATIAHVDTTLNANLQSLQAQNGYLNELKRQQTTDAARAKQEADQLGDLDKQAKDSLARATALLTQLSAEDRKAYEDQQRKDTGDPTSRGQYNARTETEKKPADEQPTAPAAPAQGLKSSSTAHGNRYEPGSCVYWAYERRMQLGAPVGSLWGSALSWPASAAAEGFPVDHTPVVGAVYIAPPGVLGASGWGHAAVVEAVNPDGSFTVSEMNAPVAWQVTRRTVPASGRGMVFFIH